MKAVIYCRYSSHNQGEQSIEGQLRDNYEFAKREGLTVINEYIDRALTGKTDSRPAFQHMMADAQKRQFDIVIVWKLDRFARNRYDSATYRARLKKYGVRVVSAMENITDGPEGIILEGMLESMAEYYSANLSQNIKRGIRESLIKGNFVGSNVPYGYRVENRKLVIDERTAPMMRYLFEQYAAGTPKKEIIDELNKRGYKSKSGKPFTMNTFQRALKNPVYIGKYKINDQIYDDVAEAMIDEDTFQKVQEKLQLNARTPGAQKAKVDYLLQGKAFCGMCGMPMVGESGASHTGNRYYYYSCRNRKKNHICKKKNEQKEIIERYVVEQTMRYVLSPVRMDQVASAVVAEYKKEFSDTQVEDLEKAINRVEHELDKLVDALTEAPKVAHKRIYEKMEKLENEKSDLEIDLSRLKIAQGIQITEREVKSWLKTFCSGDIEDEEFCKRIIDTFINAVYLYDDRIIIFYNIRGGKQVSYTDLIESEVIPEDNEKAPNPGSDLASYGGANALKFEPFYVFVSGIFGCVFMR